MTEQKRGLVRRTRRLLVPVVAMGTMGGGVLALTTAAPAFAGTTYGTACSVSANVSLFGGPYGAEGCTNTGPYATANSAAPSTTWTYGTPTSINDTDGMKATYGPADIVSSPFDINDNTQNTGKTTASSSGTAAVNMSAKAVGVGPSPFYTATPSAYPISATPAGYVLGTCTATSPTSRSGQTTIVAGYVDTKLDANGYPVTTVPVPVDAFNHVAANTRIDFTIDNVGDHGHMVFNEQTFNANGSITVTGAHMYMEGPTALGDVLMGTVTCGHA